MEVTHGVEKKYPLKQKDQQQAVDREGGGKKGRGEKKKHIKNSNSEIDVVVQREHKYEISQTFEVGSEELKGKNQIGIRLITLGVSSSPESHIT